MFRNVLYLDINMNKDFSYLDGCFTHKTGYNTAKVLQTIKRFNTPFLF